MILLYRLFYITIKSILLLVKPLLPLHLQNWISLRFLKIDKINNYKNSYWFHAASGEIEYCKSVIRLLKEQQPNSQIVVTYSSPSAEKLFQNIRNSVDQFIALSWDQPEQLCELIDYVNPKVLIFSRTDLWPELIYQVHKRKIKIGVISFNPKFNFLNTLVYKYLLPKFNFISCVEAQAQNQLENNNLLKNISSDGDTRFDQVFYRLGQNPKLIIKTQNKILVCGSTWPEDELILVQTFTELIKNKYKIILSPHEVDDLHIQKTLQVLNQHQLSYQLLSKLPDLNSIEMTSSLLIIDKIGYLADCYRYANMAFVGGSFKEKVHSVMEPLCCGVPVITGPFYKNNPEAIKYQQQFVFSISTSEQFLKLVLQLSQNEKKETEQKILFEMKKNLHASQRVLQLLTRL